MNFIMNNLGTIIVGLVVATIVGAIIVNMIRKKKNGESIGCSCGCGNCPSKGICHPEK